MPILPTTPPALRRRLTPLVAAFFFGGVALWVPIEKLFLAEIGFTPQTIGVMAAAYATVVPILELPSGILADRWSRKGVLVIGNVGAFGSVLIGGLSTGVTSYVVAAMLLGVYFAMQSGTFDAIVYDTVLDETGSSELFERMVGRVRMAESGSLVLGALVGGALAAVTAPRVTYFVTLPFLAASTLCLVAFREPRLHRSDETRSLRQHLGVTYAAVRHQRRLVPVIGLLVLTALLTQAVFEFGPLWLVDVDAGAGAFGPAWAGLMAALGIGGVIAGRVRLTSVGSITVVASVLALASGVLIVGRHPILVTTAQVALVLVAVVLGIFLTRLLHDAVSSDVRSGVSSGVGAASWIVFLPFAVGFGALSERAGVHAAGGLLAAIAGAIIVLLVAVARLAARAEVTVADPPDAADLLAA